MANEEQLRAELHECRSHLARLFAHADRQSKILKGIAEAIERYDYQRIQSLVSQWQNHTRLPSASSRGTIE